MLNAGEDFCLQKGNKQNSLILWNSKDPKWLCFSTLSIVRNSIYLENAKFLKMDRFLSSGVSLLHLKTEKGSIFRNDVFSDIQNSGRWTGSTSPVILSVKHLCHGPFSLYLWNPKVRGRCQAKDLSIVL